MAQLSWQPFSNTLGEYIQVNFGKLVPLFSVATKGDDDSHYLTQFRLQTTKDGVNWVTFDELFIANVNDDEIVTQVFEPVLALAARILPIDWAQKASSEPVRTNAEFYYYQEK